MEIERTPIDGLIVITPDVFADVRGVFSETYHTERYSLLGIPPLVQDNESISKKDVLRGIHFQFEPHAQGKLIRVVHGSVVDVVVDLRPSSHTFGAHFKIVLSAENKKQFWVPVGFAHGFLTLEDDTHVLYKCSSFYQSASECTLAWDDESIGISWGIVNPIVSNKDSVGLSLQEISTKLKK